jgi:hypothetical protein
MQTHLSRTLAAAAFAAAFAGGTVVAQTNAAPVTATQYSSSLNQALLTSPDFAEGTAAPSGGGQYQAGYQEHENSGWMDHLTFEAGAGFTQPLAGAGKTVNTAYNFTGGIGYNFVPRFGVLAEYSFNRFGLTDAVINEAGTDDGNTHLWSLTLEPIFRYANRGRFGGYVIGGGGFYRQLTSFTDEAVGVECDPFYGCYPVGSDYTVSHFSSNQGGANIGLGFTYKLSDSGKLSAYSEARYQWIDTPGHSSEFVPVTFGLRW